MPAYAAGKIDEATFLSAVSALRAEPVPTPIEHRSVTPAAATAYLRDMAGSLRRFDELVAAGDLELREQAEWWTKMIRAVYARITVVGTTFVGAQLTPAAYRHGLAVALPDGMHAEWRARPGRNPG